MRTGGLRLSSGHRVAVIGGGPAGSFFSTALLQGAIARGLDIQVTIFDGKDFEEKGPRGCNMCAGVISESLLGHMEAAGFHIPQNKIQSFINGYRYITPDQDYRLDLPHRRRRILSVYRGNGPRFGQESSNVSFDELVLGRATSLGAQFIPHPILSLSPGGRGFRLDYGRGATRGSLEADLVVVAAGLNTRLTSLLRRAGFGYRPPLTARTVQAELPLEEGTSRKDVQEIITLFSLNLPSIRFGALTPKRGFVSLTLVGWRDLTREDLLRFLHHPKFVQVLGSGWRPPENFCVCYPKIALHAARHPYTDRLVVIGDAAASRYFKNGIESAFVTAHSAARTILQQGYAKLDFRSGYRPSLRSIRKDNVVGKQIFWVLDRVSRVAVMNEAQMRVALDYRHDRPRRSINRVMWSLFTGNEPYWKIALRLFSPRLQWRLLRTALGIYASRLGRRVKGRDAPGAPRRLTGSFGPIRTGQRVVIVGGGPAGMSCAIALKRISAESGRDIEVVVFEAKELQSGQTLNPCAGVLSPPLRSLMEQGLHVPFPEHLIQKQISGYVLHSDQNSVMLQGVDDDTVACGRGLFDQYMLQQASACGVRIEPSRVNRIEILADLVIVQSTSATHHADVVVGAFGLDDGSCSLFERGTAFRQPDYLETIITQVYPGALFMESFGAAIHAFLPSHRRIDFGAITPKSDHLTVNIAGRRLTPTHLEDFLALPPVRQLLPPGLSSARTTTAKGKFPNGPGRHLCGDRYLVIGDAAGLLRPFKGKGVTAACQTGIIAAETILHCGISESALANCYQRMREVILDQPYGKVLRQVAIRTANFHLMDGIIELAKRDPRLRQALFLSVSGLKSFREISLEYLSPALIARSAWAALRYRFLPPRRS